MTWFLLLIALAVVATAVLLVLAVRRDGLGTRIPPASHVDWTDGARYLPTRPS